MDLTEQTNTLPALIQRAQSVLADAKALTIDSDDMQQVAVDDMHTIKDLMKQVKDARDAEVAPHRAAIAAIDERYSKPREFLESANTTIRAAIGVREQQVAAQRREAQRVADEKLKKAQEEAFAKAAQELSKADALREEAEKTTDFDEVKIIEEQIAQAEIAASEVVIQAAIGPHDIFTPPPKIKGVSTRLKYEAECYDKAKFIAFVAANPAYLGGLKIDQPGLNKYASNLKDTFQVDGCRLIKSTTVVARKK